MRICCMAQETQTGALYQPRWVGCGREMGGRFKTEGIHVYLWLIRGEVSQKTVKFCKAIILQYKKKLKKKKKGKVSMWAFSYLLQREAINCECSDVIMLTRTATHTPVLTSSEMMSYIPESCVNARDSVYNPVILGNDKH